MHAQNDHIGEIMAARPLCTADRLPPPNLPLVRGRDWRLQPYSVATSVTRIYATKYQTMLLYVLRRIVFGAFVLIGTSIITFAIAFLVPADPAVAMAGAKADPQTLAMIRTQLGLDQPLYIQYARYLDRALHGDLGRSYIMRDSVTRLIAERFPATAVLALCAMVLSLILGVVMGIVAAAYKDRAVDHGLLVVSLALISVPVFVLGTMLLIAGGLYLHSFPLGGFGDARSLIFPTLTLALGSGGYYSRILHTSLGEVMGQDYIRTALGKGLSRRAA